MASSDGYPRPDFQRPDLNWTSLNGQWNFCFDDEDIGVREQWQRNGLLSGSTTEIFSGEADQRREITVPFVFQTPASGINERSAHEVIWYERTITDIRSSTEKERGRRLLVRFGAVDYEATVWLNAHLVGTHRGGHVPFNLDLTAALEANESTEHRLTISVRDSPSDLTQPRGKQYWAAELESIWYTPSSGIWQSVWLESVPYARIGDGSDGTIIRSNDIVSGTLDAEIVILGRQTNHEYRVELEGSLGGVIVSRANENVKWDKNKANIKLNLQLSADRLGQLPQSFTLASSLGDDRAWKDGLALWSPEFPTLYGLKIRLYDGSNNMMDEVHTTTGMRSLEWQGGDNAVKLNGEPYFQALVLDQGYWPGTNMTPPTQESLKSDIEISKAMGFNGCRKHQKVEDPLFLYWADRLGYIVWGEMANAYEFSAQYVERFNQEWLEAVKRDINHPCVFTWTPGNESWGYKNLLTSVEERNHLRSLYYLTKTLDPTRSINDNCGWEHVLTDLTTFHDYTASEELTKTCASMDGVLQKKSNRDIFLAPIDGATKDSGSTHIDGAPVICTEFGGINIRPADPVAAGKKDWGYTTAEDPTDLLKRLDALFKGIVDGKICCGFVYTQLTDIEQEVNGLYTFDRKPKLEPAKVKAVMDEAKARYYSRLTQA